MALIISSKGPMSGKEGGIVYSHNRFGTYTRRLVIPTNPSSIFQAAIRSAFQNLANRWLNTLTPAQRADWETYAQQVTMYNRLGAAIKLTGMNHYIRSNTIVQSVNPALVQDDGPSIFDLGTFTAPTVSGFVAGPPSTVQVTYANTDTWYTLGTGGRIIIYASRPNDPSVNFCKGPFRRANMSSNGDPSPLTVTLPFNAVAGQRVWFQARAFCEDGRLSPALPFRLDT
jgi:hypothetical protein